jgi:putative hemolysin
MTRNILPAAILLAVLLALCLPPAGAMKDPSAVYCKAMGYTYTVVQTAEGPAGSCFLPDRTTIDSWQFLQGAAGQRFSYCAEQGYRQQVVRSYRTCGQLGLDECLVCVLPDGSSAEVTRLMNLSFAETTCGDGSCGMPENAISCPADCKSGGWDNLCDGRRDGRCDPDCPDGAGDPDCGGQPQPDYLLFAAITVVVLAVAAGAFLYFRKKRPA